MAEILIEDPRKKLYSALVSSSDKELAGQVKKYSYNKFNSLLDNNDFVQDLFMDISERGVVLDPKNPQASKDPYQFVNTFVYKESPTPKPQAAPIAPAPVEMEEEEAFVPEPQPLVGSPEYDKQLQKQYGGMAPTLGATFGGVPASFETEEQKKQEQISPAFKAQQLAFEDVPIAEEQRRAQRQFAKATKEQQQAALRGGTGAELKKYRQAESEGYGDRAAANVEALWEGAKNAGVQIFNGLKTVMNAAALNETPMDDYEREYYQQQEFGKMYEASKEAENNFQDELYRLNVSNDVLKAVDEGNYSKVPEASLQTIGNVGISAISSLLTAGGSMYFQTLPEQYREGVEAIAREKGITPEDVIRSGDDAKMTAQTVGGIVAALERAGAGRLSKSIMNKGGYKAVRDFLIRNGFGKTVGRAGGLAYSGSGEFITEYGQQGAQQLGRIAAASEDASQFFKKLPKDFLSKEAFKERFGAGVGGFVGGAGVVGLGRGFKKALGGGMSLDKFSEDISNNELIQNAAKGYEDNIARAEEQGRKPDSFNQKQLKKITSDPEAWVRDEIKYLKQAIESNKNANLDSKVEENSLAKATSLLNQIKAEKKGIEEADIASAEQPVAPQEEVETVSAEELQGPGFQIAYAKTREEIPQEYRGIIAEVERPTTRLGRFGPMEKMFAYRVPVETIDITAPEVTTEEDLAEDIPFEELPPVTEEAPAEEVAPETGMFEGIAGPQAEEEVVSVAPVEEENVIVEPGSELFQKILDNGEQVVSRLDAEKRIGDGEKLFGFNEQDDSLVELSLQNLGAFPVDTIIAVRPEVIEEAPEAVPEVVAAAPVEEVAPEAPATPAPKGRKKAAPVTPAPAAPKKEESPKPEPKKEEKGKEWTPPSKPDDINTFPLLKGIDVVRYIPESVAQKAWEVWDKEYQTGQSLQRTKERGGFGVNEMDMFYPNWRQESNKINTETSKETPKAKEESPKPEPKKEETPTETKPSSTTPQEGDAVEIAPQREGGSPRKMVFKDGEWKQNVGGDIVKVGPSVQQQAQEVFGGKAEVKPAEAKAETEFTSKQESSASQEFDGMKKPSKIKTKSFDGKHGKGAFERMKNITDNFEDIMDGMSGKIKQDCL